MAARKCKIIYVVCICGSHFLSVSSVWSVLVERMCLLKQTWPQSMQPVWDQTTSALQTHVFICRDNREHLGSASFEPDPSVLMTALWAKGWFWTHFTKKQREAHRLCAQDREQTPTLLPSPQLLWAGKWSAWIIFRKKSNGDTPWLDLRLINCKELTGWQGMTLTCVGSIGVTMISGWPWTWDLPASASKCWNYRPASHTWLGCSSIMSFT
jgi:hypothetical protein